MASAGSVEIGESGTMSARLADWLRPGVIVAKVLVLFMFAAVFLVALGLFGLVAFIAQQRNSEMGLRMALGASRVDVSFLIVGSAAKPAATGIAIGLLTALGLAKLMSWVLYGITATDPSTFVGTPVLLLLVVVVSAIGPCIRVGRQNLSDLLRSDGR